MPDPHFITRELDRRIALAKDARSKGSVDARGANAALMPWAAAEAWIVGHLGDAISPRDGKSRPGDLCSLDATIAELTRARDTLARKLIAVIDRDLAQRWKGLCAAVRDLERLRNLRAGFRDTATLNHSADVRRMVATKPALPPAAPSLLADMFGEDGKPLPIQRNAA